MAVAAVSEEVLGLRPVPERLRTLGFLNTWVLWFDLGISFLVMVVGMFLVPGLSLAEALLAILVGAVIGNALLGLAATVGTDTRLATMALLRPALGLRGSYLPTGLNVLQLIGWASLEVIVMAQAANALSVRLLGFDSYHAWIVLFAVLTTLMAVGGPVLVVKAWMQKFAVWVVLGTTAWLTVAVLTSYDIAAHLTRPGTGEMTFWLAVDLVVAMPISWFPLVADYSRFARSRAAAFWGTALGYFTSHVWFYALGAMLALAAGVAFDPNAPITPLIAAIASLTAGWVALFVILVHETDEGFANIYSTAVSLQNLLPRASHRLLALAVGAVVLLIAATVPLVQYETFLLLIGSFFVPLLGVLAADYFVLRGRRYLVEEVDRVGGAYWYGGGFNVAAIAVWALGVVVYLAINGLPALGVGGLAPWLGATLPSFLVAFIAHTIVGSVAPRKPASRVA
jgi:putative hydroxymethylpyrimidine transporter CytX